MKIAYIVPSLVNKGPVIVVNTLVKQLVVHVDTIHVYYFDLNELPFACPTYKLNMDEAFNFDDYDIIHTHGYRPDKYLKRWKGSIDKAITVSTIHADIIQDLRYSYNWIISKIFSRRWFSFLKCHDAIVVISEKLLDIYKNSFERIYRVYNGVDLQSNIPNLNLDIIDQINSHKRNGLKVIGTYAYLTKRKGLDQLISFLALKTDYCLIIFGEGKEKRNLVSKALKAGVSSRITFFPYIDAPYNYVSNFDIYAMPSRSEGFGLALVEAAMCKASIVCSDLDVFKEIFTSDQVSFFELENVDSLSLAMDQAYRFKSSKGIKAYDQAIEKFSGQSMGLGYLELYNTLLKTSKI